MPEELIIDLTNYKDRIGSRVAEGRYKVVVEDAEADKSSAGNPMVNIWFRINGGTHDGATIVDRLVLTEKSLFRVVGFMQAIGLPTPKKRLKINIERFVGQHLEIDVEDGEPYNGRVKSEVRGYLRMEGANGPSSAGEDELFAQAASATPEPAAAPPAAAPVAEAPAATVAAPARVAASLDAVTVAPVAEAPAPVAEVPAPVAVAAAPEGPETIDLDTIDLG